MSKPITVENSEHAYLLTTRTIASQLWFVRNKVLEEMILAYLAKYQEIYGVILYGLMIMGNHIHLVAKFPNNNRAKFMRIFNSMVAKLVAEYEPEYRGGKLWGRPYRAQLLGKDSDITYYTLYTVLNPVSSGLCKEPDEYYGYNSFEDSVAGKKRTFKLLDRDAYHNRLRFDSTAKKEDFIREYTLAYSQLPEFSTFAQEQYEEKVWEIHEERRQSMILKREADGFGYSSPEYLKKTEPGDYPRSSKTSTKKDYRPLVLSRCKETFKICLAEYFDVYYKFKRASKDFLSGIFDVVFPKGTYPPCFVAVR